MIETKVSRGIISTYFDKLQDCLELDAAIVGGGPSGIVAAYYLAKAGLKVAQFDRKLAPGGGMWGGAMMFNQIVIQEEAMHIVRDFEINHTPYVDGLYTMDSVESTSSLLYHAVLSTPWTRSRAPLPCSITPYTPEPASSTATR